MSMKKIVLFAGTTEGHRLCECFVQNKWQAEVFVATEYSYSCRTAGHEADLQSAYADSPGVCA